MRHLSSILVALLLCSNVDAGVKKIKPGEGVTATETIDPRASAGLFVGVRDFTSDDELTPVKYAVDDAVDLAFELAINIQPPLLPPARVVLALSGDPEKTQSQQNLRALLNAGASKRPAELIEVLKQLKSQSGAVGKNGVLVVAFATHGVSEDGTQYLLTADSMLSYRETILTATRVCDIVSKAGVERSLILIDACRERLTRDKRTGENDPRSVAAITHALAGIHGQVVFSAAGAGDYAYDDDERGNGVFTAAVIDGLRCGASKDSNGFITVDTLSTYVEEHVLQWIRKHKNASARKATQLDVEGRSKMMPLAMCTNHSVSSPQPRQH